MSDSPMEQRSFFVSKTELDMAINPKYYKNYTEFNEPYPDRSSPTLSLKPERKGIQIEKN